MSGTGQVEKWRSTAWNQHGFKKYLIFLLTVAREKQHENGDQWKPTFSLPVQEPPGSVKVLARGEWRAPLHGELSSAPADGCHEAVLRFLARSYFSREATLWVFI